MSGYDRFGIFLLVGVSENLKILVVKSETLCIFIINQDISL